MRYMMSRLDYQWFRPDRVSHVYVQDDGGYPKRSTVIVIVQSGAKLHYASAFSRSHARAARIAERLMIALQSFEAGSSEEAALANLEEACAEGAPDAKGGEA